MIKQYLSLMLFVVLSVLAYLTGVEMPNDWQQVIVLLIGIRLAELLFIFTIERLYLAFKEPSPHE